ncbi:MAG: UvrD-helicase domain-containing protein, partial [Verrucomicrobiota bacterium]
MSYPNEEQQAVLRQLYGTLLVLAPAGSGKTRIMANRLAAVIADGVAPGSTLGVTFTNRAAEQMYLAVRGACGSAATECRIQTFHSLCAWMLRLEARDLGLPADFVIYDEQDSIDLLRDCLAGTGVSPDAAFWQLSQIKSDCPPECLTLGEIPSLNLTVLAEPYRKALEDRGQRTEDRGQRTEDRG